MDFGFSINGLLIVILPALITFIIYKMIMPWIVDRRYKKQLETKKVVEVEKTIVDKLQEMLYASLEQGNREEKIFILSGDLYVELKNIYELQIGKATGDTRFRFNGILVYEGPQTMGRDTIILTNEKNFNYLLPEYKNQCGDCFSSTL